MAISACNLTSAGISYLDSLLVDLVLAVSCLDIFSMASIANVVVREAERSD